MWLATSAGSPVLLACGRAERRVVVGLLAVDASAAGGPRIAFGGGAPEDYEAAGGRRAAQQASAAWSEVVAGRLMVARSSDGSLGDSDGRRGPRESAAALLEPAADMCVGQPSIV